MKSQDNILMERGLVLAVPYWVEPHRYYHNADHLAEGLMYGAEFLQTGQLRALHAPSAPADQWPDVGWIWNCIPRRSQLSLSLAQFLAYAWHDAVYLPFTAPNENYSANLMMVVLGEIATPDQKKLLQTTCRIIKATADHHLPTGAMHLDSVDQECLELLDIDLMRMAAPPDLFEEYSKQVRQEYAHVPIEKYARARLAFFNMLKKRYPVYRTIDQHPALAYAETQAQANIEAEIGRMAYLS